MRINNNIPALNTHRLLNINTEGLQKSLERLSSGKRINRASDDAAGLAISEKMEAQIRGLRQASRNSLDGVSLIQTAEGALNEVHEMIQRMRELSVQGANGIYEDGDLEAIANEIKQLTEQIDKIANDTEFNGISLLKGDLDGGGNTDLRLQIGANESQFIEVDMSTVKVDPNTLGIEDIIKEDSKSEDYEKAIEKYNDAIEQVSKMRSKLGAIQNRLEHTIKNVDNTAENLTASKSRIADLDMAQEMSEFTKLNILQQAGTSMLSQANQLPQMVLQLLQR
ncbi:flagellin [Tissierella sp. MB52-C2]|uniref:flagellin N-terminal helical domain-containing protein n=1 Tax=Tissierella sp. MB52-C2 TaxID=3070999 RepID=UPI00280A5A29|nr:flagellin [Tissierella sp. MB52-C2]WMM24555.1 flagellin [Tissierella sp. MB52-C2]